MAEPGQGGGVVAERPAGLITADADDARPDAESSAGAGAGNGAGNGAGDAPAVRRRRFRFRPADLRTADRWLVLVIVVVASCIVAIGVRAALDGWLPTGDDGYYALRSHDVFSRNFPLLGTNSSVSGFATDPVNHPGPLQFLLLSIPVTLLGVAEGAAIGTALINAASIVCVGWLLRRRCGPVAAAWAVVALGGLGWAMGSVILQDPWGPFTVILPFALFAVAGALAVGGDVVALPFATVAGSLVFQTHTSYVLLYPGLTLLAWAGAVWWTRQSTGDERRHNLRWLGISGVVTFLCWLPPLVDQVFHRPGNMVALFRARTETPETVTPSKALEVMAGTVAFPPWWLPPGFGEPRPVLSDLSDGVRGPAAIVAMLILVAGLAWALRDGLKRGDRVVIGAAVMALALLVVGYATLTRSPWYGVEAAPYIRFLWPTSIWVWFTLALAVGRRWLARTAARSGGEGRRQIRLRTLAGPVAAVLAVLVGVASIPHKDNASEVLHGAWQDIGPDLLDAVVPQVDHEEGPVLVRSVVGEAFYAYGPMLMAELADRGIDFVVDGEISHQVGERRKLGSDGRTPSVSVLILQHPEPDQSGELIFSSNGVGPNLEEDIEAITSDIRRTAEARGRPRLTKGAYDLLAEGAPDALEEIETILAKRSLTVEDINTIDGLVGIAQLRWADGTGIDPDLMRRWHDLQLRRTHAEVAVYLERPGDDAPTSGDS